MVKVQRIGVRTQDHSACDAFAIAAFIQERVGERPRRMGGRNALMQLFEFRRYLRLA